MADLRQWRQQWTRLARQEGELGAAAPPPTADPLPRRRQTDPLPSSQPQLGRAQLARHLASVQAMQGATGATDLPRRHQQVHEAQAALEAAAAAELARLAEQEQAAAAEWDAAAQHIQQLLQATPRPAPEGAENSASNACSSDGSRSARRPAKAAPTASAAAAAEGDLPPEVAAWDAFLRRHGPTGGWHPDDHAEFERILRACRGNYAHCAQLAAEELGLLHSADDVAAHARWHEELQRLQLAKRLAVQRWRAQRQAEQAAALEQQQAQAAAQKEAAARAEATAQAQAAAQRKEEHRAAVQAWRAAREQQAAEAAAQKEAEERERQRQEQLAMQARQQENRRQLEQRRRQKEEQEAAAAAGCRPGSEASWGSAGSDAGAAHDPATLHRLRERNAQLLAKRAQQVQARGASAAAAAERAAALARRASEQFAGAADRDPARLLQPTSAAALRQLATLGEERAQRDSGYIRHVSRRGTPSWCGGARLQ